MPATQERVTHKALDALSVAQNARLEVNSRTGMLPH